LVHLQFFSMREGNLEIILKVGGVALKETKVDEKTYAAAEAGREFTVEVKLHKDSSGEYPFSYGGVCFHVDGKSSYNAHLLHLHRDRHLPFIVTKFIGYNYGSNAFTFGDLKISAQQDSKPSVGVDVAGLGTMTVYLYEMKPTVSPPVSTTKYKETDKAVNLSSGDNKKFWEAPSLTTVPGRQMTSNPNIQPFGYVDQTRPHSKVTLHYHNKEMIRCLQAIHAQNTATDSEEEDEEDVNTGSSSSTGDITNTKWKSNTSDSVMGAIKHESSKRNINTTSSRKTGCGVIQIIDSDDDEDEDTSNNRKKQRHRLDVVNLLPKKGYTKQHDGSLVDLT
jgi:hypothetical protein